MSSNQNQEHPVFSTGWQNLVVFFGFVFSFVWGFVVEHSHFTSALPWKILHCFALSYVWGKRFHGPLQKSVQLPCSNHLETKEKTNLERV